MKYMILAFLLTGILQAQQQVQKVEKKPMPIVRKPFRVIIHPKDMVSGDLADKDTLWMQEVDLKNGTRFFFEGTLHAFLFYYNPEKYSKGTIIKEEIGRFTVRDFATGKKISADSALFIANSKLRSPAGLDLVPVNKKDAKKLKKEYGGKILKFSDITKKFIEKYAKKNEKEAKKHKK